MPRACSTLFQNILAQNPNFYATPTDGLPELLNGARESFTNATEFKAAIDQDLALKSWRRFCKGGLLYYTDALTDKPNIILKGRGWKADYNFIKNILEYEPKIFCLVRNLKSIVSSFEKLYRRNPDKSSQWFKPTELRGTTVGKRVDMYLKNQPLCLDLDRIEDLIQMGLADKIHFIRAEDLCARPDIIMNEVYNIMGVEKYNHNFDNIKQITHENDVLHELDNNLHTIDNKVKPLIDDYYTVLGDQLCSFIDSEYKDYQKYFQYIS